MTIAASRSTPISQAVAVVTGAASGIGLAAARRLLADGLRVGVCDLSPGLTEAFVDDIAAGRAVAVVGDTTDPAVRAELVARVDAAFGRLDVLVNNAASGGESAPVATLDLTALRRTLEINVVAVIALIQECTPLLSRSPRGRVINLGSLFGDEPVQDGAPYCVSKGAIHTLTRVLALELGAAGITANTIAPGYILTPMHAEEVEFQARARGISADERYAELRAEVPVGRHGTPEDVAATIAWLACPDSAYVSGQKISVSGGVSFA
ncbi:SDR family NAD(P)-dependent oxidoreductase [Leucobacter luti]|uniref:Gluconate 5-dehydrogenase/3-oxoacyl-[acyl-carrier protein] reductase n=1 Tax=Leucobacter luti TaxID=340320 RepID=A0A4Q7U687_9MICO|nr:SDR family oxidoreductase [Leucobacter luti]RZT68597.1 gluconate 5-dehydrogenase/3-oxoacyl-[acyl-carrier protein] reductase [Leucobacter luti]